MPCSLDILRRLAGERLGLDLARTDPTTLSQALQDSATIAGLEDHEHYLSKLSQLEVAHPLWLPLLDRLTISETYFFRDQGQIDLLKNKLLPELSREASGRRLRIWSAGCSTGEELYTLGILADGLGKSSGVELYGTDLNPAALEIARNGLYKERTLRNVPVALKAAYFEKEKSGFRILERLRDRARFMQRNLAQPEEFYLRGIDLIVCRNVLIYFQRDKLTRVVTNLFNSLRPGGILVTGHGEILNTDSPFETLSTPTSLLYRRPHSFSVPRSGPPAAGSPPPPSVKPESERPDPKEFLKQARCLRLEGRDEEAKNVLTKVLYLSPECGEAFLEFALLKVVDDPDKARKNRSTALELMTPSALESTPVKTALRELDRRLP